MGQTPAASSLAPRGSTAASAGAPAPPGRAASIRLTLLLVYLAVPIDPRLPGLRWRGRLPRRPSPRRTDPHPNDAHPLTRRTDTPQAFHKVRLARLPVESGRRPSPTTPAPGRSVAPSRRRPVLQARSSHLVPAPGAEATCSSAPASCARSVRTRSPKCPWAGSATAAAGSNHPPSSLISRTAAS